MSRCHPRRDPADLKILGPDDAAALLREAVPDDQHEGELVLGLDWSARLCGIASRISERDGPVPEVCAHLEGMRVQCRAEHVGLVDHLLMAGHRWRSVAVLTPLGGDHAA